MHTRSTNLGPRGDGRRCVAVLTVNHIRHEGYQYAGGAEKYARLTIAALLDAGVDVHVGYSGSSVYDDMLGGSASGRLTLECTDWVDLNGAGDARLRPRTIWARRRWLRETRADTVLAIQQFGGGSFGASLAAGRCLGLRVVASMRQLPSVPPPATGKRWIRWIRSPELWRRRLIWRRRIPAWCCDALIFNSRRVADEYHRYYGHPRHRERIIPNGETIRGEPSGDVNHGSIASVGRVTRAKGADILLDAFGRIAGRHPNATLTYVGDGPLIPDLRDRADRMGVGDRVRFTGYREDRDAAYRDVGLYVQASRRESMSNSVIEAMARGIPCVVADVGGLSEAVADGQSGFVVPPEEPGPIAEAIDRLLSDRESYARFSEAGLHRVRTEFSLDRVMRETVETILGISPEAL